MDKVSVIVPVYNAGGDLKRCIESLIHQTHTNLQIILVDDGSTDGSGEICDRYAQLDSRIIVVHQPNRGVSKARNVGLILADGDYYSFPDSDDYLEPDTYSYLLDLLKVHQCDAVNYEYYVTWEDHETVHLLGDEAYGLFNLEKAFCTLIPGEPFAWNKIFSKHLITGVTFREDIFRGEDTLFVLTAMKKASSVWFDKRPLYHYVQTSDSACRGSFRTSQLTGLKLFEEYRSILQEEYPLAWRIYLANSLHLPIMLYFDMYNDKQDYKKEMKYVYIVFKERYKEVRKKARPTIKNQIKFGLFKTAPCLYCLAHKILQEIR